MNHESRRARYLRDPIPTRLGNLAANLARISTCLSRPGLAAAALVALDESKWFIEWTAMEVADDVRPEMIRLQVDLALWQLRWAKVTSDPEFQNEVARIARQRSNQVLEWSGLLNR